jgi:predicted porin
MFKRIFLVAMILISSTTSAVELNTTFYGKLNLSYNQVDPGEDDWVSNASRVGIKGAYPLTESTKIVFQLEQSVDVAHGGTDIDNLLSTRNSFIGLKGKFGRIIFGTHDTPTKRIQSKIDQFNDYQGDIKTLFSGEVRARDAFLYTSPKFASGFQLSGMYVDSDNDFDSSKSLSLSYSNGAFYTALSYDDDMRKNDTAVHRTRVHNSVRVAMQYRLDNLQLGGIYQSSKQQNKAGANDEQSWVLTAAYKYHQITLRGQLGEADRISTDRKTAAAGLDYNYDKNSKFYLNYLDQSDDQSEREVVEVGVQVKF